MLGFINKYIMDVEVPVASPAAVGGVVPTMPGQPAEPAAASPTAAVSTTLEPALDAGMLGDLQNVIKRRSSAFSSLDEKIITMQSAGLPEAQATMAAFALLKAEGKTSTSVISAIDIHISDIETEQRNFSASAKNAAQHKVASLRTEIDTINGIIAADNSTIETLRAQIATIQDRVSAYMIDASNMSQEANRAESEIVLKISKFAATAEAVKQQLNNKKMTLSSILK